MTETHQITVHIRRKIDLALLLTKRRRRNRLFRPRISLRPLRSSLLPSPRTLLHNISDIRPLLLGQRRSSVRRYFPNRRNGFLNNRRNNLRRRILLGIAINIFFLLSRGNKRIFSLHQRFYSPGLIDNSRRNFSPIFVIDYARSSIIHNLIFLQNYENILYVKKFLK